MDDQLKQILKDAIREEEYWSSLYAEAVGKTDVVSAKDLLMKLSEHEKIHKEKLETLDFNTLEEKVIPEKITQIDVAEELMLTPINEFKDVREIFDFAIKAEIRANNTYTKLAESVTDEKAKELFTMLAGEEEKHRELLKNEREKLDL